MEKRLVAALTMISAVSPVKAAIALQKLKDPRDPIKYFKIDEFRKKMPSEVIFIGLFTYVK